MAQQHPNEAVAKAVIYAAKSTEDRHGSIPAQLEDGRAMAEREGWRVIGEYDDEAASAYSGDRGDGLTAAMEHAEREAPSVLLVQHSDRLARGDGRSARHLAEIYFWAIRAGVQLRSVQDDSTFTNPLLAVAMGERNAEDSRRKSLAVAAGMRRRAEKGRPNGGPRPYGYRYDGGLVKVASEAAIVGRIFTEFIAGRSLTAISRDLQRDGVPTMNGGRWRQSTVSGIVANPVYVGLIRHDGETFEGEHEAVIDADAWRRASAMIDAQVKRRRGRPPKGQHLFRGGMLRCECGEAMIPRARDGYELYYCDGRAKFGTDFCAMKAQRREPIDSAVYRYFEQVGLDVEATRAQLADARERKLVEVRALREQAESEERMADGRLARVRRDYQDGKLDPDDWAEQRDQLTGERQGAHAEADRLRAQERAVASWGELEDVEAETLRRLSEIRAAIAGEVADSEGTDAVRAALTRMFERFVLHRSIPERAHVELIGETWIEPVVREQAVEGYTENLQPIMRREAVNYGAQKTRIGLPWR